MSRIQRIAAFISLGVVALAIVFALLPFNFAGVQKCGPALLGSEPRDVGREKVGLVQPERDCERTGRSRLATSGFLAILGVLAGAGITQVQAPGKDCREGRHDDCHGGWPALMGLDRFACQCSCHRS
ncbi:MAG TPA: hypothetical protein VM386_00660 [Acidimicrobiales bacterium]|nr:hypothetical protein [Acidimicrobiales bacterium]